MGRRPAADVPPIGVLSNDSFLGESDDEDILTGEITLGRVDFAGAFFEGDADAPDLVPGDDLRDWSKASASLSICFAQCSP
jgi:hypothetical protein